MWWISPRKRCSPSCPPCCWWPLGFFVTNYLAHDSLRPPYAHRAAGDNWYDYPGSYWYGKRQGVDLGEPSQLRYALHVLIGHHGIFSLTPIWLLSLIGMVVGWGRPGSATTLAEQAVFAADGVCLVFYIVLRPEGDRNYGGVCCGFRWMFWFIPLWLLTMLPVARLSLRVASPPRCSALALLAVSVLLGQLCGRQSLVAPLDLRLLAVARLDRDLTRATPAQPTPPATGAAADWAKSHQRQAGADRSLDSPPDTARPDRRRGRRFSTCAVIRKSRQ